MVRERHGSAKILLSERQKLQNVLARRDTAKWFRFRSVGEYSFGASIQACLVERGDMGWEFTCRWFGQWFKHLETDDVRMGTSS
jgi:hypothetical protein